MSTANSLTPLYSKDSSRRFMIDITVPHATENDNHMLLRAWARQSGGMTPPPPMTLPRQSEGAYTVRIRHRRMADLIMEEQYSDAIAGRTGGPAGHQDDRIKIHVTHSGAWHFNSPRQTYTVGAGMLCVRRNDEPWDFAVARGTRAVAISIPDHVVRFRPNWRTLVADQSSPAAHLLLAHLRSWEGQSHILGPGASEAARDATVELFKGMLSDLVVDDEHFSPALVSAAMECIERRLLTDPHLDPRAIADALNVSVRTLHRAFNSEAKSVMEHVRDRRLTLAREELMSSTATVSELAARWHFTDSSHFVRAYKKRYGQTPAADRLRGRVSTR